jgi:arabinogalactan endo-1,4-beta-galactosidase
MNVGGGLAARGAAAAILAAAWLDAAAPAAASPADSVHAPGSLHFGADVTSLDAIEVRGVAYRTAGEPRAPLGILKEAGFGTLRLQVLVDPPTGYSGLARSATIGARLKGAGFRLLLDLRCSDGAADDLPRRWRRVPGSELAHTVRSYVRGAVDAFRAAGAPPDLIQVGHDVARGFLGAQGAVGPDSSGAAWDRLAELLGAGLEGARRAAPRAQTVLSLGSGDAAWRAAVLDSLAARGVACDLAGVSWLPWYDGTLPQLEETLRLVAERSPGGVLLLETAYPWTLRGFDATLDEVSQPSQLHPGFEATPHGQGRWLAAVIAIARRTPGVRGVYWGDPLSNAAKGVASSTENLALFDGQGRALPALFVPRDAE